MNNKVTTSTPGSGTALTLTTKTAEKAEKNGAALGNVEYTLTITNTSDGTVSTIVGRTDSSGTDSKTWTAPTAGLYAITTTATGGLTSDTVYYLAGVQSVEDGETSTTETVYTLESTVGKENQDYERIRHADCSDRAAADCNERRTTLLPQAAKQRFTGDIAYTWQSVRSERE